MLEMFWKIIVLVVLTILVSLQSWVSSITLSSSVWCSLTWHNARKCTFKNLCYNFHSKFIFALTENSVLSGLESRDDLKHIYTTSLPGHTALPLKISVVNENYLLKKKPIFFKEAILLHRFKPDNIMHVIHDDLLPLYSTFMELCLGNVTFCTLKYHLFFSDQNIAGPFLKWYYVFSKTKPVHLHEMDRSLTVCFSSLHVGLSQDSVFYQYGFLKPRGIYQLQSGINYILNGFRTYILNAFNLSSSSTITNRVTLITRKLNRKILNERFVENTFKAVLEHKLNTLVKISIIDFMLNSSQEILLSISTSKYLVGMHGAGMFLALFLPNNSYTFELFPYGIDKERVSPIFILSQIPGIQFKYFAWHNTNELNTFPHTEYLSSYGGLDGLSKNDQLSTLNLTNTPSYLCCDDAVYLSRMYQDTIVDDSIYRTIDLAMNTTRYSVSVKPFEKWFFPSFVLNVSCFKSDSYIFVNWSPPFNMYEYSDIEYRINLETMTSNIQFSTKSIHFHGHTGLGAVKIWIQCMFNGIEGLDTYLVC